MHDVIRLNSFGLLVSNGPAGIQASHLPFVIAAGGTAGLGILRAHVARANQQWKAFDGSAEVLTVFQGAHGYISPAWYPPGPTVPTWDYVAVHAYGAPRIVGDDEAVLAMLSELVDQNEAPNVEPWSTASQEREYLVRRSHAVVAFEIPITRLEGKAKLGQNRSEDQAGVAAGLDALGTSWAGDLARAVREANAIELR